MAKAKTNLDHFRVISLRELCRISGITYFKLRNNLMGNYDSLDTNEKTTLCNSLVESLTPVFRYLGYRITIKRLDE